MLSSHLLTEVETIVSRVIIIRRGNIGLAKKLVDLEVDPVIEVEVRGPVDKVTGLLAGLDGVASVDCRELGDGVAAYSVHNHPFKDLREQIGTRVVQNGWSLRRLDLRRRKLQDRWNEINNMDDALFGGAPAAPAAPSTAVST
jgi:hypothetical protein